MRKAIQSLQAMLAMLAVVCASLVSLTACSDDDEPTSSLPGEEMVAHIKSIVLDGNGEILFGESTDVQGLYAASTENENEARNWCEMLINDKWDGKDRKVTLPDNCGTIELRTSDVEEGIWCMVIFNVRDIPDFTLLVASPEYCDNNNFITPIAPPYPARCPQCNRLLKTSEKEAKRCDDCGHTW